MLLKTFQFLHSGTKKNNSYSQMQRFVIILLYYYYVDFCGIRKKKSSLKMPANPTFSHTDIQEFSAVIVTIPQVF